MFVLHADHLMQLCEANEFPIAKDEMVFFGLRGCLPLSPFDHTFAPSHRLDATRVDYLHPRCVLAQLDPVRRLLAVYPGSTVPHRKYVELAKKRGGMGCNQLMSGFWDDYRKGRHRGFSPTGHDAWQQTAGRPFRRTADDLEYDTLDRVDTVNPADNLHAGWCAGLDSDYSSAGCQVVVGFPQCKQRGDQPSSGPWRAFVAAAWSLPQVRYGYVLLSGTEVERAALVGVTQAERVRFGSSGPRAARMQAALKARGYYEGDLDGTCSARTLRALLHFQEDVFGAGGGDGVCGPQTAEALQIAWP